MKLIAEKLAKNDKYDRLRYIRSDGSESVSSMPRQGTLPHDLVHFVVESTLPLRHGFLSLVASGSDAASVAQSLHDKTHPVVAMEAAQAEAVVEALQTQLWSGSFVREDFEEGVRGASAARDQPAIDFHGIDPDRDLFRKALDLYARWQQVPWFQSMSVEFGPGAI